MGIGSRDRVRLFKIIGIGMGWHGWGWQLPHDRAPVALHGTSRPRFSARSSDARTADWRPPMSAMSGPVGSGPNLPSTSAAPGQRGDVEAYLVAQLRLAAIPQYWNDTADWLDENNNGTPTPGRVLVVPGAPFATQVWGTSHDEPLQALGHSPWGVRDSIPLTPPQTIRALDSVQRLLAAGRPSAGLADTLARQGISYVVVRNDLDPEMSRSARPVLVHRAIDGSPGLTKVAQFGEPVGPGTLSGFVTDSGLRPRFPAVEIYRVDSASPNPSAPYLVDTDAMARAVGGADLCSARRAPPAAGPTAVGSDAADRRRAARRANVASRKRGHNHRHPASPGNRLRPGRQPCVGHPRRRRRPPHLQQSARLSRRRSRHRLWQVDRRAAHRVEFGVGFHRAAQCGARGQPRPRPSTATRRPVGVSNALQSAVGQSLQVNFDHPVTNATITITPSATAVGAQIRRLEVSTVNGTSTLRFDEAGKALTAALPYGETPWVRVTAVATDDGSPGVQFGITDFTITQYDASGFAHPVDLRHTVLVPGPPPNSVVAQWDLGSELLGRAGARR